MRNELQQPSRGMRLRGMLLAAAAFITLLASLACLLLGFSDKMGLPSGAAVKVVVALCAGLLAGAVFLEFRPIYRRVTVHLLTGAYAMVTGSLMAILVFACPWVLRLIFH